ncbi:peroxiredoxin [Puniceicoccales bacterium CK1056]|uniref:thioredoxin-dependent peroxiredoxin n=1 Tax=Oceanipulchritudo coccoides TaxID=2706888 RepID=A0A6B2M1M4_9BACT|nr:peroxiredoxin [Oceanipulchritudo coccoides]NDV62034.1 peroxiredoxin [Oceanipulchritudo coccoides]
MSLFASNPLEVGAEAPTITVITHKGTELNLGELYAKGPVLVYFYPRADTPGCTKQACNIRDNFDSLTAAGIEVIGVSMDSVEDQSAFQEKYDLPFLLVADEDKQLGKGFGVGGFMGMAYRRQSFLVVDGTVVWRDLKAKPASQSADILAALKDHSEAK